jgi:hypothetical protein
VKKALKWVIIAGLAVWVVNNPGSAAHLAHHALAWLSQAGHALTTLTGHL